MFEREDKQNALEDEREKAIRIASQLHPIICNEHVVDLLNAFCLMIAILIRELPKEKRMSVLDEAMRLIQNGIKENK